MRIRPFRSLSPPPSLAAAVASPPYDVLSTEECRALIQSEPRTFLRVVRPEADGPEGADSQGEERYRRAARNLALFREKGWLVRDERPAFYLYRLVWKEHEQNGLVALSHTADYESGLIRRHEHTRPAAESDRARHILELRAQTGPVFLTYRDRPAIDAAVAERKKEAPLHDFTAADGVRHTVWRLEPSAGLSGLLSEIDVLYIADGHHRSAAAARAARELRGVGDAPADRPSDWFLTVLFPAGQLRILPYNRLVHDLNGRMPAAFLEAVRERFETVPGSPEGPGEPGCIGLYLDGCWHALRRPPPPPGEDLVEAMDVSVLQNRLLEPLLGIRDPRHDPRLSFVGGIRGNATLRRAVDEGRAAAAFALYPTSVRQLMAVADAGRVMPPKSTWFEPKLRSGLFVHPLGEDF